MPNRLWFVSVYLVIGLFCGVTLPQRCRIDRARPDTALVTQVTVPTKPLMYPSAKPRNRGMT